MKTVNVVLCSKNNERKLLRQWHERLAKRRGFTTAVALARKLTEIIFYALRDQKLYDGRLLQMN